MKVRVARDGRVGRAVPRERVRNAATAMLRALELPAAELSVLLCDDPTIRVLNRTYRRKDKPTDVLAFAMREGFAGERSGAVLGDVVISIDTAERQAREHGHSLEVEVFMLLAHGLLHLLGWDHRTDAEDRRMRRETSRLLDAASAPSAPRLRRSRQADSNERVGTRAQGTRRART